MKKQLAIMLAGLMLIQPSCITPGGLEEMDAAQFARLVQNVESVSSIGLTVLKPKMSANSVASILDSATLIKEAIGAGAVPAPTSLLDVVDFFARQLDQAGVSAQEIALIKASLMLVDNALGGIRLGVDGIGSERTEAIVLALCKGIELGLK